MIMTNHKDLVRIRIIFIGCILFSMNVAFGQDIRHYVVKKTNVPITIDGKLNETQWGKTEWTEPFVEQETGAPVANKTQAKLLWDDQYLYVAFVSQDSDVWSTYIDHDAHLWEQENVEIFADPNGDGYDYFELEINPLGTVFDMLATSASAEGDVSWDLQGLKTAVWVNGTINNAQDVDSAWYCETAIPFESISSLITPMHVPPQAGEEWRIELCRYNRPRDIAGNEIGEPETSVWNKTDSPSFHVPSKFGRIIFSDEVVTTVENPRLKNRFPDQSRLIRTYPNPFNSTTNIEFRLMKEGYARIEVSNILGEVVAVFNKYYIRSGKYSIRWNAQKISSGIYFCKLHTGDFTDIKKMILIQ